MYISHFFSLSISHTHIHAYAQIESNLENGILRRSEARWWCKRWWWCGRHPERRLSQVHHAVRQLGLSLLEISAPKGWTQLTIRTRGISCMRNHAAAGVREQWSVDFDNPLVSLVLEGWLM